MFLLRRKVCKHNTSFGPITNGLFVELELPKRLEFLRLKKKQSTMQIL